ncbi:MAG: GTP 3',8-cyclase MoaA, partial [Pseudomonadota bacterium]
FLPKRDLLTLEELDRLCTTFVELGVRKLRITGGEPLVRKNIMWFFERMGRHLGHGLDELTLTTNGSQLGRFAQALADVGVRRVNVSLDTLNAEKFREITRWGKLGPVLDGIRAAQEAGMRVKLNTVALKGFNEDELFDLIDWCAREDLDLTFIEVMPMGDLGGSGQDGAERLDQYWSLADLRTRLGTEMTLAETDERSGGPARYFRVLETNQKLGFITPLTHNFCESCNRVRLTCTGKLYMCLGQDDDADLCSVMRESDDPKRLEAAIREAITRKPKGHDFDYSRQKVRGQVGRHMSLTGG